MTTLPVMSAADILDRDFLHLRHRVLDVAAGLDRLDRADGSQETAGDPRMRLMRKALAVLSDSGSDRAERVQLIFSDPYEHDWRTS